MLTSVAYLEGRMRLAFFYFTLIMKAVKIHLKPIDRQEKDWLIKHGYLKLVKGEYPDLTTASRRGKGKRKRYYIVENLLRYLPNK